MISLLPSDGTDRASVYPNFVLTASSPIQEISFTLCQGEDLISGETLLKENTALFYPCQVLQPDSDYQVTASLCIDGRNFTVTTSFSTDSTPLPDLWVEVALGDIQRVYIHEGTSVTHTFPCSGGTAETPSLLGCYHLKERGPSFYSQKWKEGALYWIRISDQYLFHSIPRRQDGSLISEEADKIGSPASHGCIRLRDDDALWLYEHIPDGTLVILHPASELP